MTTQSINIAILGASGYTGAELIRILALHPKNYVQKHKSHSRYHELLILHCLKFYHIECGRDINTTSHNYHHPYTPNNTNDI